MSSYKYLPCHSHHVQKLHLQHNMPVLLTEQLLLRGGITFVKHRLSNVKPGSRFDIPCMFTCVSHGHNVQRITKLVRSYR